MRRRTTTGGLRRRRRSPAWSPTNTAPGRAAALTRLARFTGLPNQSPARETADPDATPILKEGRSFADALSIRSSIVVTSGVGRDETSMTAPRGFHESHRWVGCIARSSRESIREPLQIVGLKLSTCSAREATHHLRGLPDAFREGPQYGDCFVWIPVSVLSSRRETYRPSSPSTRLVGRRRGVGATSRL